ncbi:MAG: sulfatase [Acidobacteria bacterium]|nr:sulfatase [Acidobacteriota bacterium]
MRRGAVVLALLWTGCPGRGPAPPPPTATPGTGWNVLLVTIDTLRADHMGTYGYGRNTSPHMDALGREGVVFERAYTYWPKTRASMVMMLTGRRPSQNGYSHRHPRLLDFNPTLASVLKDAGYATAAIVDNANVAKALGYAKGFDSYREIWEEKALGGDEWKGTTAITEGAVRFLADPPRDRPFLLWLHYVNPHAPYAPPAPHDQAFVDDSASAGPKLRVTPGFRGGIPRPLYVSGRRRLGYYVSQYDGEVSAVDSQIGVVLDALRASGAWDRTVLVVTSDHGESLGEHEYYFDHGEDLFDPCLEVPLIVAAPGGRRGARSDVVASTLDVMPTILDAVKVRYPPDLAGESLLPAVTGGRGPRRSRLFAQNDRSMSATFDARFKLVAVHGERGTTYALYDRESDPGETRDVARAHADEFQGHRRELERYLEIADREWATTRRTLEGRATGEGPMSREACERLKALGYVDTCGP